MQNIPFTAPDITAAEENAVMSVLRSGWLTTGKVTAEFENTLMAYCGAQGCVCPSSATAGLECALRLCGIGEGDEVILPAYTFTATAAAVLHVGAIPVLADCEADSFHLAADAVSRLLTPKTAAVIPVDIGGVLCDYDGILAACESVFHKAKSPLIPLSRPVVIADAAHSLGAFDAHGKSGALADMTVFSFHATKNLTCAEGGALLWRINGADDPAIDRALRLMMLHGQSKSAWQRNHGELGYDIETTGQKCNLSDIHAAIGLSQLKRYPDMLKRRAALCRRYDERLPKSLLALCHGEGSACHLYMALLPKSEAKRRDKLAAELQKCGICCNLHFPPLPVFSAYKRLGFDINDFPNAIKLFSRELTLPLSSVMTDAEADAVISALDRAMR